MAPPPPPGQPPRIGGPPLAIGGIVLAIVLAGLGLALIPRGDKHPARAAAPVTSTPTPTATKAAATVAGPSLAAQVQDVDAMMRMSERGRSAAVKGNFAAAVANRATLARRIARLQQQAKEPGLRAGLASFGAAVREALRQNRTCRADCSAADLARVGRLKQQALTRLNPLLRRYAHTHYSRAQI
jgi:hypothetical protein